MPTNPFGAVGSKGDSQNIDAQTRAVRAYEQARAKLISSMKGEERAIAGVSASHAALMRARSTDDLAHEKELLKTTKLLGDQGKSLKDLNIIRERYHREEMIRSQSLLQRYEGIKKALKEIQADTNDTSTLIGSFMEPYKAGVENMKRFGDMATVSAKPVGDLTINLGEVSKSFMASAAAAVASGRNMYDMVPKVISLGQNIVHLDQKLAQLTKEYNLAEGASKKLAMSFVDMARIDLSLPNAVNGVAAVTAALEYLQVQGVATDTAMAAIVENTRSTGRSFEESAHSLEAVSEGANLLRDSLKNVDGGLRGFTLTMRDDFVRAVAEATRNIDSQVVSVENVAAAYRFAAENAIKYGASAKGAENIAKTYTGIMTREGAGPTRFLTGQVLADRTNRARREAEEANKGKSKQKGPEGQESEFRTAVNLAVAAALGLGSTAGAQHTASQTMRMAESSGGQGAVYNLVAGTAQAQVELMRQTQNLLKGVEGNAFAQNSILASMEGFSSLSQSQQQDVSDLMLNNSPEKAAEAMTFYQKQAAEEAKKEKNARKGALSAALAIVDPINSLFSIEALMKSQLLTMENVYKGIENFRSMVASLPIFSLFSSQPDYNKNTGAGAAFGTDVIEGQKSIAKLTADRVALETGRADAIEQDAAESRTSGTSTTSAADALTTALSENSRQTSLAIASLVASSNVAASHGWVNPGSAATVAPAPSSEAGRQAGLTLARQTNAAVAAATATAIAAATRAPGPPMPRTGPQNATRGQLSAGGVGNVVVDTSGRTVIRMDLLVNNPGAMIDNHAATTAYAGPNSSTR